MYGSDIMMEVTNLSSLAYFRSGTSRLGPVSGEITQVHVTKSYAVFTQLWFSFCTLTYCVKVHASASTSSHLFVSKCAI